MELNRAKFSLANDSDTNTTQRFEFFSIMFFWSDYKCSLNCMIVKSVCQTFGIKLHGKKRFERSLKGEMIHFKLLSCVHNKKSQDRG